MTHAVPLRPGATMSRPAAEERWQADEALEHLYAAHWASLVRLATLLLGDQGSAEEVTQDAFVAMHDRWHRLQDPGKALAYLRQTVVNRSRSVLRHRGVVRRQALRDASSPLRTAPDPESLHGASEERRVVLAALADLPRRQREVLVLRHYGELSEAEIADALGISRGAVKSHASRGSAALRRALAPWLEETR